MRSVPRLGSWVSIGLLALLASCGSQVSNTGYTGTWSRRGANLTTTLAIVPHGDGYLFRWGRESDDGKLRVRCDWAGDCVESYDGVQVGTYTMRAWVDPESGLLRVEGRGRLAGGENQMTEVHYVDELRLRRRGTRLVSRLIENHGQPIERGSQGKRVFEKISDDVIDPPPAEGARE
jgi:hypothetical protein